ncbi:uncharacterized protein [Penaeus vannamei]|uniref:uncharacterized protein n=1 Tax=Penaeus vannamei TaxID=6689 RepID=UPI00387FAD57
MSLAALLTAAAALLTFLKGTAAAPPTQYDPHDDLRAWVCETAGEAFPAGGRILMARPGTSSWEAPPACEASNEVHPSCDTAAPTVPGMGVGATFSSVGVYLECSDSSKSLLSGLPGAVSECLKGEWTHVSDLCVEECESPRDCAWVAQEGFTDADGTSYRVIPSGDSGDQPLMIFETLNPSALASTAERNLRPLLLFQARVSGKLHPGAQAVLKLPFSRGIS